MRVYLAISIARTHSVNKSENIKSQSNTYYYPKEDIKIFMIDMDRELLYERINKRVDIMVQEGLIKEARKVFDKNLPDTATCKQSIGYKEFFPYFKSEGSLEDAIELLKKETRKYAKRQETYFKNQFNVIKINGKLSDEEKLEYILDYLNNV